jgi:hypothetical protein
MGFHMFTSLVQETYPLTFSSLFEKKLFLWVKLNILTTGY